MDVRKPCRRVTEMALLGMGCAAVGVMYACEGRVVRGVSDGSWMFACDEVSVLRRMGEVRGKSKKARNNIDTRHSRI
jgi:thiamine pyrophosphate-dependent acetolactate synthase large subunit-like protein